MQKVSHVLKKTNTSNRARHHSNERNTQRQDSHVIYLHDPLDVAMTLSEVDVTEFSSPFSVMDVGFEHRARTFTLSSDNTSHRVLEPKRMTKLVQVLDVYSLIYNLSSSTSGATNRGSS